MEKKLVEGFNAAFKEMKLVNMGLINRTIKKLHLLEAELETIVIEKEGKFGSLFQNSIILMELRRDLEEKGAS